MVRVLRWALIALVVAGCPGTTTRGPSKPGEVWLAEIKVVGNKTIPEDDLVPGLVLDRVRREGRAVDPYQLALDARRIRGAYLRMGFFDAKVDPKVIRNDYAETVVFTVIEGPRMKARVAVTGLPPEVPEAYVLAKLELKEGAPFDYELYDEGREIVKGLVAEAGYARVVDDSVVTVDRSEGVAFASYRLDPGPRSTFGKVLIRGVPRDGDLYRAIQGRLTFREGEPYAPSVLVETQRGLYEMGRFSQVRISPDLKGSATTIPITIQVGVAGRIETRLGGGFGYEPLTYEARIRAGASYVPVDYPLQTYSLDSRVAATVDHGFEDYEPKVRVLGSVQRLEMFRPYVVGEFGAGVDFFTVEAYTAAGGLLRLGASSPLGRRWLTAQAGWAASYLEFSSVSDAIDATTKARLHLNRSQSLGKYEQSLTADLRDNPLDPRKGVLVSMRVAEGTIAAAGSFEFVELLPDVRVYYPWRSVVFAAHIRGGVIYGDIPVTERFFSGGAQNHRGFSARDLSPRATSIDDSNPVMPVEKAVAIGGDSYVETGVEARVPLGELIGLMIGTTIFVDAGDVVDAGNQNAANRDLDPFHLHWAAGIGIFAKYGGFKVRIDAGHRLNRRTETGFIDNTLLFLGVGETF
ncbi:MAG: BamA/TamA family outer membrane protein [Kofleriaceae bacterium]